MFHVSALSDCLHSAVLPTIRICPLLLTHATITLLSPAACSPRPAPTTINTLADAALVSLFTGSRSIMTFALLFDQVVQRSPESFGVHTQHGRLGKRVARRAQV